MFIIPYQVDVPLDNRPVFNWLIIAGACAAFGIQMFTPEEAWVGFVLDGFNIQGLFGHVWLHGGLLHLLGNMLFLWVFGNAVCAKVGNVYYPVVYFFVGFMAAVVNKVCAGGQAVGASGAINGIVGMYLVFYPLNNISCCFVMIIIIYIKFIPFVLSSVWMVLFWLAFDIWGATHSGGSNVGYFAHLGGFAAGMGIAVLLLKLGLVKMTDEEQSLLSLFGMRDGPVRVSTIAARAGDNIERRRPGVEISEEEAFGSYGAFCENEKSSMVEEIEEIEPMTDIEQSRQEEERRQRAKAAQIAEAKRRAALKKNDGFIRFKCGCGQAIKVPVAHAGMKGKCPGCSERIIVPRE